MTVTGAPDYQQPFENELAHLEHHRAVEAGVNDAGLGDAGAWATTLATVVQGAAAFTYAANPRARWTQVGQLVTLVCNFVVATVTDGESGAIAITFPTAPPFVDTFESPGNQVADVYAYIDGTYAQARAFINSASPDAPKVGLLDRTADGLLTTELASGDIISFTLTYETPA